MEFYQIILLSVIQGLTEFLPISSSGHLILTPLIFNFEDQGMALDAILHLGTLLAIIIFFRKELTGLAKGLFAPKKSPETHHLARCIIIASFPAGLIGLFGESWIEANLRSPAFLGYNLFFWSLIFIMADRHRSKNNNTPKELNRLSLRQILFIGCAQAIALLPGTSRSGITIAAGLFSNLSHTSATRFSFLLGTPIIFAAGMHKLLQFITHPPAEPIYSNLHLLTGLGISFLVGLLAIQLLLKIVAKVGLLPFIIYRIILAGGLLLYF
ncbi:MAG: undecaprenyl-diphosphate phosphatase [Nitrospinaceae bacterium]|jgi:undecaprenyl-diphosphatase|nr:undecaprenyl-diphosphate phosphatase [Nitrospina sp.]MBT5868148.1 undecaprenyl-diphosphate phosphatase [Nitrospinaceae bacterium]MBT6346649.1 undecaprenyl-diphosphate phosphatase [Nitrospina sp.]